MQEVWGTCGHDGVIYPAETIHNNAHALSTTPPLSSFINIKQGS
jgi:hypothetical protein